MSKDKRNKNGKKDGKNYDKNQRKGSDSRGNFGEKDPDCKPAAGTVKSDPMNEPDMYFDRNDPMSQQLFEFSFNQFQGVPFDLGKNASNKPYTEDIASIMRIELNPCPGWMKAGTEPTSGINMQGLRNFITLSANNAKTTQYAPQDVTTLMLALGEVISMISWGTRTFGLYQNWNVRNRTVPRTLLLANKIDADDFIAHIAQYRQEFNYLIITANKIPFFSGIEYLDKCAKLYKGFYQDSPDSDMAQYFMFVPLETWQFDEAYSSAGTGLRTDSRIVEATDGAGIKFSVFLDVLRDQISNLLNSATLNYIYSDVLRILETKGGQRLVFGEVADGYMVLPSYEPEAIHWLHNMRVVGGPRPANSQHAFPGYTFTPENDVVPNANKNCVEYRPQFRGNSGVGNSTAIIDFPFANPNWDNKVEATRLMALKDGEFADGYYYSKTAALSDHYACAFMFTSGNGVWYRNQDNGIDYANFSKYYAHMLDQVTKFDHGPLFYITDESDTSDTLLSIIGDVNYYTTIDEDHLRRIHDATFIKLMSL